MELHFSQHGDQAYVEEGGGRGGRREKGERRREEGGEGEVIACVRGEGEGS
jgi:hypothetical protein